MESRRGFLRFVAGAAAGTAALGCKAQEEVKTEVPLPQSDAVNFFNVDPKQQIADSFIMASKLREAGLLVFERRCWEEVRVVDGRSYGRGCGSYFRWLYPGSAMCPFCSYCWPVVIISQLDIPLVDFNSIYPLTLNFTGKRGSLNEFEEVIWNLDRDDKYWNGGVHES